MSRRVVITGTGLITPLGIGKKQNISGIIEGRNAIKEIASFDVKGYRGKTGGEVNRFNFSKKLKRLKPSRLDRATKLLLVAVDEALLEAGLSDGLPQDASFILGTTLGGMFSGEIYHKSIVYGKKGRPSLILDYLAHCQGAHLTEEYGLKGKHFTISNACASGTNAIGFAFRDIRSGRAHTVIAGGYDTMCEFTVAGFNSLQAVTPLLCRPFDKGRDGLVLGEGVGVMVLEEMGRAEKRGADIIAEIEGYGESSDAFHITRPDPGAAAAAAAISDALRDAQIDASRIDYINAHGTATPYNDAMEAKAIQSVFGNFSKTIPVSSIKSMIGHLLGGAGAVEAVITILAMKEGILPPNLNYKTPDPECPLNIVDKPGQRMAIKRAVSNSFGFGGANAAIVFQDMNR
jgi:3-oxoacyl-[acyl-carrier-protein] synthase II